MRSVTRAEVLARAHTWTVDPRGYSQQDADPLSGYRLDCSGYVSMAWRLDRPGLSTVELPDVSVRIGRDELAPGDVLMIGGPGTSGDAGHVMIFERWSGAGLWAYEHTGGGTRHHDRPYPDPAYLPYRFRLIT